MPTDTIFSLSLNLYSKKARIKSITPVSTYMISSVLMNFSPRPSGLIVGLPPDAFSLLLYKSLLCTLSALLFRSFLYILYVRLFRSFLCIFFVLIPILAIYIPPVSVIPPIFPNACEEHILFLFSDYQFLLALFYIYADLSTFMSILYFLVSAILKKKRHG